MRTLTLTCAAIALAGCSGSNPLDDLQGEWRVHCGGLSPTGLFFSEQHGTHYFRIAGNPEAPVESVTEDGGTISIIAGPSRATVTKVGPDLIKANYYSTEFQMERCK